MKNRMRKTKFMALVLSVMMVVTTIFSDVTVYADNAENGWTQQSEEQTATASDPVKVSKATASDPEKNNKNAIPSDMTEEELYKLSDEGKLTKAVLTGLGAIEPQEKISVEDYIDFTCIVDDEDDQEHTNLKQYVMNGMNITELTPGVLENVAPKTVFFNEQNHMYRRAVVGNTPVYYVGIVNVGGTKYVYYVTSQKNTDRASYSVLKPGEKIDLLYVHKNSYQIQYKLENERTDAPGSDLTADEVFGGDRMEVVEENGSYTFKVRIPRGYQATVEVVDSDGAKVDLKGSDPSLGKMMSYYKKPENPNRILPKNGRNKLQENGEGEYIEYLSYSGPGAAGEIRSYQEWLPSYDGNYYFRTTGKLKDYMQESVDQGVVLLEIQGIPTKVGVAYISGGDQTDGNGNLLSPASANIVNMPGFDSGGTNGYNTVNNQYVPISTLIPRDLSGKFEFDHWQIVTVNGDGTLGNVKENAVYKTGQMAHLTADTFHNLADCSRWDENEQRSVFTLQAVWESNYVAAPINYAVHYYVDGQEIYTETHTANKGAKVIVDAWNSGTEGLSEAVLGVLEGTNNAVKDYTDGGTVRYFIDQRISTTELQDLQQDNNALHIYFVTADIKWTIRKQWLFTATGAQTAPTGTIQAQIQRKTADESGWENVSSPDGGVIELTSAGSWKTETGNLPLYKDDNVAEPYTYRVVELDHAGSVVEEGNKVSFQDPASTAGNRDFLVNYQKQGKTWTILNAETPTGALKVSNTVSGAQGDQTRSWKFTVTQKVSDASKPRLNGMFGGMEFTDGVASFILKHGESRIGVGLPVGTEFTVTETGANKDGYISTCNGKFLEEQGNDFEILADQMVLADILNNKDLSSVSVFLKALKYVNNATPSDAQKYTFYLKDASGRQIQSVQNTQAAVNFQELKYSEAGTYTYYLMEANDGKPDVQYSELVYEADVEVTERETSEGYKLAAAVTYRIPGGGIVSGTPEFMNRVNEASLTSVRVIKHWSDNESEFRPQTVRFQLYKKTGAGLEPQGKPVEVSADLNGIWSYTWANLDKNTEWEVAEVEIPEKYEIDSAYMANNEWIITNRLKSSDAPTTKNVTVRKVWEDQDSTKRPAAVNVQLYKNLVPYGTVTLSADNNWQFTWTDLDASAEWTVDEIDVPEGYERSIRMETSDDQAVTTCTITNKQVTEEPKPPVQEKISITANKVWEDAGYTGRPQTVKLQLYRDGEAYGDAVTVSQAQGWRYVWKDLEKDHVWTVGEVESVSGYDVSVTHDGNEWVITNTRKASGNHSGNHSGTGGSDDDTDDDTGVSGNHKNPSETAGNPDTDEVANRDSAVIVPSEPVVTNEDPTSDSEDLAETDMNNTRKRDSNVPATGDVTHGHLWLLLAGISLAALLALILGKKYADRKSRNR